MLANRVWSVTDTDFFPCYYTDVSTMFWIKFYLLTYVCTMCSLRGCLHDTRMSFVPEWKGVIIYCIAGIVTKFCDCIMWTQQICMCICIRFITCLPHPISCPEPSFCINPIFQLRTIYSIISVSQFYFRVSHYSLLPFT